MTSKYRHRRTFDPVIAFPSPVEPGEIIVNTSNRQIAVGDAAAATLGVPKPLIGVRFFDTTARYAANDVVVQAGNLYRANAVIPPGAFNGANWTQLGVVTTMPAGSVVFTPTGNVIAIDVQGAIAELDAEKVAKAGDTMAGHLSLPTSPNAANAVRKDYVDAADAALATLAGSKVDKGGDTMSGLLTLSGDPSAPLHAATKQYVDTNTGSALVVSDTPPAGAKDGSLWWESDSGLLYVRYNDGNTIQWVIAAPQPDINAFATHAYVDAGDLNALKYSAQVLTAAQQQQARQNVYAAPFDAMAYSGLQINGGMDVNQIYSASGIAIPSGIAYALDGWFGQISGTARFTIYQSPGYFGGFANYLNLLVMTAQASFGATDFFSVQQTIEGWRIARLAWGGAAAQPITIVFWTAHHRPGLYSVSIRNAAGNRSYCATYTQNVADVPEYKIITVPGCTDGTWAVDNTGGIAITFSMGAGANFIAPSANAWATGNYVAAPGQINAVAATSDEFRLTGVIVLPGNEAPGAARSPFVMRPYDQELVTCRRYFIRYGNGGTIAWEPFAPGASTSATNFNAIFTYPPMRATPTSASNSGSTFAISIAGGVIGVSALAVNAASSTATILSLTGTSMVNGQGGMMQANGSANAWVQFDARL